MAVRKASRVRSSHGTHQRMGAKVAQGVPRNHPAVGRTKSRKRTRRG